MDIVDNKNVSEIARSMLAEAAKARNEIHCAQNDIKKAEGRLAFLIVLANALIDKTKD